MTIQTWSVLFIVSAIITLALLERILRTRSVEAKASKRYYIACLIFLIIWAALDFTLINLPPDSAPLPGIVNRLVFLVVSLVVFFFVASAIHFTPPTAQISRRVKMLISSVPVVVILLTNLIDPFGTHLQSYGWQGDISDPALRYTWLGLIVTVMIFSFLMLLDTRSKVTDRQARRSLTFFLSSHILALSVGVALYIIGEVINVPSPSSAGVSFSLLFAYPAFSSRRKPAR
jgi:hypothetical protein